MLVQSLVTILRNTGVQARLVLYCREHTKSHVHLDTEQAQSGFPVLPSWGVPKLTGAFGDPITPLGCACVPAVAGEHSCSFQAVPWQTAILDVGAHRETSI